MICEESTCIYFAFDARTCTLLTSSNGHNNEDIYVFLAANECEAPFLLGTSGTSFYAA